MHGRSRMTKYTSHPYISDAGEGGGDWGRSRGIGVVDDVHGDGGRRLVMVWVVVVVMLLYDGDGNGDGDMRLAVVFVLLVAVLMMVVVVVGNSRVVI